ncbi:PadR family transcriptional regulator [Agromyces protaetiae]|uniref:PadR family transcriptional regulator n=1 Tax=Agromyces protaetiae TaxID=2509455 RepID=A0A4P6FJE7_9MICO|nr:PadR family transcriptional regulator [Agromyces protaetiae]QAY74107.1 PadR family transcriptional regulator [Agromyces protaetiae]
MAVRDALLALLLTGPAYGFQLHGELARRTGGRREVNVGQTYATLDRLTARELIASAGTTEDGLPLHRLTEAGEREARAWLGGADASGADPWDETVDRVLVAASLPGVDLVGVLDGEQARWEKRRSEASDRRAAAAAAAAAAGSGAETALPVLAADSGVARADAALTWLETVRGARPAAFGPDDARPKRGRRPGKRTSDPGTSADPGSAHASA